MSQKLCSAVPILNRISKSWNWNRMLPIPFNRENESFSVTIKGGGNEQCVLTTPHKSYCLEKIDTSNTVLLCKRSNQESYTVFGSCGTILEVSVIYASHRVAGK